MVLSEIRYILSRVGDNWLVGTGRFREERNANRKFDRDTIEYDVLIVANEFRWRGN